jgi:hypothetical protein
LKALATLNETSEGALLGWLFLSGFSRLINLGVRRHGVSIFNSIDRVPVEE